MSTSAADQNPAAPNIRKTAIVYLLVTVLCLGVNGVYGLFGHGVSSDAMTYMFLYPLLGGTLPFLTMALAAPRLRPGRLSCNSWHSGLAALTVASMLQGVFEIAGTSSAYLMPLRLAGWLMLAIGGTAAFWRQTLVIVKKQV